MINESHQSQTSRPSKPTKLGKTVLEDLHRGDFQQSLNRDLEDVYHLFLDEKTRDELDEMGEARRWLSLVYWLIKSSILRLPPSRRLLLLAGLILFVLGLWGNFAAFTLGFVLLLLILILELKDKLLAQDELRTGRAVQLALLPTRNPTLPGWETWLFTRPANDVGGDLVDYLMVRDHRLGIALGDVAGKGLGAALVMAKLQATLRAVAPGHDALSDLGTEINRILYRDSLPSRFVSLAYVELEAEAGLVRLLNAGHLPPLIVRGNRVEVLPKGSPAFGLMPDPPYREHGLTLAPGDLMILYSDGLTEARDEEGLFFTEERLLALAKTLGGCSASEAGRRLLQAVERFAGEARQHDDLSFVVLRRLPLSHLPA